MSATPTGTEQPPALPKAELKKHVRFSPIWLIPILVGIVVIYVGYQQIKRRGQTMTLTFSSAEGLVPGETVVKHKNVRLGIVEDVHLSNDLSHVEVNVRVEQHEAAILTDHARFWIVRPRFTANVTNLAAGLQTLVSGAYIAVDPGTPGGKPKTTFTGLEDPPAVRSDEPGRVFVLRAEKLGSLGQGSPIYFHDVVVGEILKYDIGNGTQPVTFHTFIRSPYDQLVATNTHFWNVSGLTIETKPEGLRVEVQSLQAIVAGGVAFDVPRGAPAGPVAKDETVFPLYADVASSDSATFGASFPCVTYFSSAIQGLAAGASVQLLGTQVGIVREVKLVGDAKRPGGWLARVAFDIQPERIPPPDVLTPDTLRAHPPRVVLDSVNIITGGKVLTLDFDPIRTPKPSEIGAEGDVIVLPGESGGIDNVTTALGHVAAKIEQIPFDQIGKDLDATLRSVNSTVGGEDLQNAIKELSATIADAHRLVKDADQGITPALAKIPVIADQLQEAIAHANRAFGEGGYGADSDFQRNVSRLMQQVAEAARSVRVLADFLDRHPDALLRGRSTGENK